MASHAGKREGKLEFGVARRSAPGLGPDPAPSPPAPAESTPGRRRIPVQKFLQTTALLLVGAVAVAGGTKVLFARVTGRISTTESETERSNRRPEPRPHLAVAPRPDRIPRAERTLTRSRPHEGKRHRKHQAPVAVVAAVPATQHRDGGSDGGRVAHHSEQSPAHVSGGHDNGGQKQTPTNDGEKEPTPPARPGAELYHFFNPHTKDHRYLTDYEEGAAWDGYEYRSTEGKIFTEPTPGTIELSGEEGHIGYIFTEQEADTTALYYCISGYGDLLTTDPAVADNAQAHAWDCKGVVGYVGA